MTLGERIRENRVRAGLSQEQLAELTGVSRQAVGKWEAGQAAPGAGEAAAPRRSLRREHGAARRPRRRRSPRPVSPAAGLAEEVLALARQEEAARKTVRRAALLQNARRFLAVCGAYLLLYLTGAADLVRRAGRERGGLALGIRPPGRTVTCSAGC